MPFAWNRIRAVQRTAQEMIHCVTVCLIFTVKSANIDTTTAVRTRASTKAFASMASILILAIAAIRSLEATVKSIVPILSISNYAFFRPLPALTFGLRLMSCRPTIVSIDSSSLETSLMIESSLIPSTWSLIEPISLITPMLNSSEIIDESVFSYIFSTAFPQITTTPTLPEPSPTVDFNVTYPPTTVPPTSVIPETKIFIPRFNGYNSSLIYRSKRSKRDLISISISLKSDDNITGSVPVVYTKNRHNHELLIYIKDNSLNLLLANRTDKLFSIKTDLKITAKEFNKIDIKLQLSSDNKTLNFSVKLNDIDEIAGQQDITGFYSTQELCSFDLFYLGAIPWIFDKFFTPNDTHFFNGCIKSVIINNYEMFLSDAKVSEVSECLTDAKQICGQKPCRNGGHCQTDGQHWHCVCADGYGSDLCERAHCWPQLCHNDGICLMPDERHYLCVCPYGWTGINCEISESTISHK